METPAAGLRCRLLVLAAGCLLALGPAGVAGAPRAGEDACRIEDLDGAAGRDAARLLHAMRCLEAQGRHSAATLAARRLLALGAYEEAAREVLARTLPRPAAAPRKGFGTEGGGWVAFEFGHDSNINRGAPVNDIAIPLLANRVVPLDPLLKQKSSIFLGTQLGGWAGARLPGGWFGALQGDVDTRFNSSEYVYFPHNHRLALQLGRRMGSLEAVVIAAGGAQSLGKHLVVDDSRVGAAVRWAFLPQLRVMISTQSSQNRYPRYNHLTMHGTNWGIGLEYLPLGMEAAFLRGTEQSGTTDRSLDRDYDGVGAVWRRRIGRGELVAAANRFRTRYGQPSTLFQLTREEAWSRVALAYEVPAGNNWRVTPRIVLERNAANLDATSYRRRIFSVEARKDF